MERAGFLGDIGAFQGNKGSLGLARRAQGEKDLLPASDRKAGEFFWIERDRLSSTDSTAPQWTALEAAAYGRLSPANQQILRNLLWFTQGDPLASKALGSLLTGGKLLVPDRSGVSLVERLGLLTTAPLDSGLERGKLLRELISQLNDPMLVNQGNTSSCAAAVVQNLSIKSEPADYVALVVGLVSPSGISQLPNGQIIHRDGLTKADGSNRASVDQVVQNSLMEYATGGYDSTTGRNEDGSTGLTASRFDHLVEGVMNTPYQTVEIGASKELSAEQAIAKMKQTTAKNELVPVGLQWKTGGHKILVQGFNQGLVYYYNPWGRMESMTEKELADRIHNASFL